MNYEFKSKRGVNVKSPPLKCEWYLDGVKMASYEHLVIESKIKNDLARMEAKAKVSKLI